jgi:predicted O-linked N-acetylglucosamine transferase (SPINDLY family)
LAEALAFIGDMKGALAQFEHTKRLDPNDDEIHLKRLMFQNYGGEESNDEVYRCHVEFGKRLEARYTQLESFPSKEMTRNIRVAYVSTDFMQHSVSYFFLPIAKGYDHNQFDFYCYSDMPEINADEVTEQLKDRSTHWRDVNSLTNDQLYAQIRNDEIDILVDLVGYTGNKSRMAVFARKAAPVQVTYLAYANTTGLTRMDYRIVDEYTDPVGKTEAQSSEKLVRLNNSFLCYEPENMSPSIEPLPADSAGIFTFGSFNNYMKITDAIIDAWSKILSQVPNSRLYVKASVFSDKGIQNDFIMRCKVAGIERKRLLLSNLIKDVQSHLEKYNIVDLHLDTYPYNGTTTTLEAVWMGVPTVTWAGDSHRSRVGNSIMSNLGLTDYIAQTKEEYIDIAVSKANDLDALRAVRAESRTRVAESPIMDNKGFVKELEDFYRKSIKELAAKGES